MHYLYRISDKSYHKAKLPGSSKRFCLENFCQVFGRKNLTVLADNCEPKTIEMVKEVTGLKPVVTQLGNAGALKKCLDLALELPANEIVYFVEDDYLHSLKCTAEHVIEGLNCADYTTLYDHPDKYQSEYTYGESTILKRGRLSHWKLSISTTMTFATKVGNLKKDFNTWKKWTGESHPADHQIFSELGFGCLSVAIPGLSCHTDLTYSELKGKTLIDDWALDLLEEHLESQIENCPEIQSTGLRKLMELSILGT